MSNSIGIFSKFVPFCWYKFSLFFHTWTVRIIWSDVFFVYINKNLKAGKLLLVVWFLLDYAIVRSRMRISAVTSYIIIKKKETFVFIVILKYLSLHFIKIHLWFWTRTYWFHLFVSLFDMSWLALSLYFFHQNQCLCIIFFLFLLIQSSL